MHNHHATLCIIFTMHRNSQGCLSCLACIASHDQSIVFSFNNCMVMASMHAKQLRHCCQSVVVWECVFGVMHAYLVQPLISLVLQHHHCVLWPPAHAPRQSMAGHVVHHGRHATHQTLPAAARHAVQQHIQQQCTRHSGECNQANH